MLEKHRTEGKSKTDITKTKHSPEIAKYNHLKYRTKTMNSVHICKEKYFLDKFWPEDLLIIPKTVNQTSENSIG